jgi:pilus assembly protein CpaC
MPLWDSGSRRTLGTWFRDGECVVDRIKTRTAWAGRPDGSGLAGRILRLAAALAIAAAAQLLPLAAGDARADREIQISGALRTRTLQVYIGKSQDVRMDASFTDISVGDPEVADVNPLTDKSLSILGRKNGTTRVSVYAEGKKLIGIFDIEVTHDTSMLQHELQRRFPYAKLKVTAVNGRIMLSGNAPDAVTVDKAITIARQFAPDVINTVGVTQPQQVMLEVRFVEASRTAGRELGVQWNMFSRKMTANIGSRQPASNLPIHAPTSSSDIPVGEVAAGVLSGTSPFGFLIGRMIANGMTTDVLINALEQKGLARNLAEPNLTALSGDTASFLAGGEFPIPIPSGLGTVAIEYKKYGVGLAFTPTVLGDGLINMKIEPEVSQLDHSNPVQVAGISIPPLIVRRASTTVELRDGQSFVIGGLLQSKGQTQLQQLPWIGDLPVLGALFRSAQYQKNETDLIIIVTPRIVRPARPDEPIKTPLDATLPVNDVDLFLMGKVEAERGTQVASRRLVGHILDLPKGGAYVAVKN